MVKILIEGSIPSLRDPVSGKKMYVDIIFMGGRVNVQVPENLISVLRSRLGQECVFCVDSYTRSFLRKSPDGSMHPEVTFSPGKLLEIRDKK